MSIRIRNSVRRNKNRLGRRTCGGGVAVPGRQVRQVREVAEAGDGEARRQRRQRHGAEPRHALPQFHERRIEIAQQQQQKKKDERKKEENWL